LWESNATRKDEKTSFLKKLLKILGVSYTQGFLIYTGKYGILYHQVEKFEEVFRPKSKKSEIVNGNEDQDEATGNDVDDPEAENESEDNLKEQSGNDVVSGEKNDSGDDLVEFFEVAA